MTVHEIKIWPAFFAPCEAGEKTFEIRKNDRLYQKGDVVILKEYEPTTFKFTGRELRRRITYVASGFGIKVGWVVFGMESHNENTI